MLSDLIFFASRGCFSPLSKGKCVRTKSSGIVKIQMAVLQRMVSPDQVILQFLVAFSMAVIYRKESFYYVEWDFYSSCDETFLIADYVVKVTDVFETSE